MPINANLKMLGEPTSAARSASWRAVDVAFHTLLEGTPPAGPYQERTLQLEQAFLALASARGWPLQVTTALLKQWDSLSTEHRHQTMVNAVCANIASVAVQRASNDVRKSL